MLPRCLPCLLSLCLGLAACAGAPAPKAEQAPAAAPAAETAPAPSYYWGAALTTSPDGETPLGPPVKVLARRQQLPGQGKIVEEVWHSGQHLVTTLTRVKGGSFQASDAAGSFSGTVSFSGPEWDWDRWTYDIQLKDGTGKIGGRGAKTEEGRLIIEKVFMDGNGVPRALIREDHKPISKEKFDELLQAMPKAAT